jgi:hypothetical protein
MPLSSVKGRVAAQCWRIPLGRSWVWAAMALWSNMGREFFLFADVLIMAEKARYIAMKYANLHGYA